MTREEQKLSINSWWAGDATFALNTLRSQLEAAKVLWPEALAGMAIGVAAPEQPRCGKCSAVMDASSAYGREDGLLCDKCLTEAVDQKPING